MKKVLDSIMDIFEITSPVSKEDIEGLAEIFSEAFGNSPSEGFIDRLNEKPELSILIAQHGSAIVGFKIGYRRFQGIFFSWLGAVAEGQRRNGVARALLKRQHLLCEERGYREVQTEASGENQPMLVLNLQEGFEVYGVHMGHQDKLTVQLRKSLVAAKSNIASN